MSGLKQEISCLITKESQNSCCYRLKVRGKWSAEAWRSCVVCLRPQREVVSDSRLEITSFSHEFLSSDQ